jgi:hypothetical protein
VKRSPRKKELKQKRAVSREKVKRSDGVKRGFRKLVVDGAVYSWKYISEWVEIRVPGKLKLKWLVPIWQLQDFDSKEAWEKSMENDDGDRASQGWWIDPAMVRKYIDEMRKVTCTEGGTCGCKK